MPDLQNKKAQIGVCFIGKIMKTIFFYCYQERQKILSGQDTDIASGFESDSVTGHMCLF